MIPRQYVKVRSWHILRPNDQQTTLCGLDVRAHPDPHDRSQHQAEGWSFRLELQQRSCETCLRLFTRGLE